MHKLGQVGKGSHVRDVYCLQLKLIFGALEIKGPQTFLGTKPPKSWTRFIVYAVTNNLLKRSNTSFKYTEFITLKVVMNIERRGL